MRVVLDIGLVFGVDRVFFALDILGAEKRCDKKPRETIERGLQVLAVDIKKIIGVLERGKRVVAATM